MFLLLLLNFYSFLAGINDAILYGRKGAESFSWNEHMVFAVERCLLIGVALIAKYYTIERITEIGISYLFMYSFVHNQTYYYVRNRIQHNPKYSFTFSSTTSTAIFEFNFAIRTILLIIGIAIYIYTYIK